MYQRVIANTIASIGRPARHSRDSLLDAALAVAAREGPGGVTMSAVARAAGAPSGSLYHRFAGRPALLAELWLRCLDRFHADLAPAVAAGDVAAVAAQTVRWSRDHPREAGVLLHGAEAFGRPSWPHAEAERFARSQRAVAEGFKALARANGLRGAAGLERLVFAVTDIPLALVRRHLTAGERIPRGAEELVADAARTLVG